MTSETETIGFEDLSAGTEFSLGPYLVSREEILEFATRYDPQRIHTDPDFAATTEMGGLIASGWHTGAIFMRMQCDSFLLHSTSIVSPGTDQMRWHRPVRPGDTLNGSNRITRSRQSKSRPDRGIVYCAVRIWNQNEETVMTLKTRNFFRRNR